MAVRQNFRFEGVEEVEARLKSLSRSLRREVAIDAIKRAGKVVRDLARSKAPVHPRAYKYQTVKRSGKLRKPGKLRRSISVLIRKELGGEVIGYVRVTDPLGHLIEFGHATRLGKGKSEPRGSVAFVGPQPYLRPAFDENQERVVQIFAEEISKHLDRATA